MNSNDFKDIDLDEAMAMDADDLIVRYEIPVYGDRIHKYIIDMSDDEGKELAALLIEKACNVEIKELQPLEREQNTDNDKTKKNIFDNHCKVTLVNGQETRLCIEAQRSLERNSFTDKVNFNHSSLVIHSVDKGTKDGSMPNISTILLYEGSITDDASSDLVVEMSLGDGRTDGSYNREKSKVICVQLDKMVKIADDKGIDNLSVFEAMCYYIRCRHLKSCREDIQKLIGKYKEVRLMEKRYMDYLESPIDRYETLKEEMDAIINRNNVAESRKLGEEEGRKKEAAIIAVNQLQIRLGGLSKETVDLIYASDLDRVLNLTYSIFAVESEKDAIDILTAVS